MKALFPPTFLTLFHLKCLLCSLLLPVWSENHRNPTDSFSQACKGFPGGSVVKNPPAIAGDVDSIPGSGRSPGIGNDNPLQYSCLENPMDGGVWWATVHGVTKSQTQLSDFTLKTS